MKNGQDFHVGWLPLVGIILILMASAAFEEAGMPERAYRILFAVIALAVSALAAGTLISRALRKSRESEEEHSHDRLSPGAAEGGIEAPPEHYRKQLDSFLKAGLIDRREYRVMLEKYKRGIE